jgi:hypothetical protein
MRKETTICFRTTEEIRDQLDWEARKENRSLSSTLEIILSDFVQKEQRPIGGQEKRRFRRRAVAIPAVMRCGDSEAVHETTILNISLGGLLLRCHHDSVGEFHKMSTAPQVEIVFDLEKGGEVKVEGRVERIVPAKGGVLMGALMVNTDFANQVRLQEFLM